MNFFKTNIDKAKYRDSLIKKLQKRRDVLITQRRGYRNNECIELLGIETTDTWINPYSYYSYCTIDAATSNAEIIRKTKMVTAFARLLKAYNNLSEMNVGRATHPRDQALSSFAVGLVIASGPLVYSMLNSFFAYPRKRLFTLNDMTAFTKVLVDAHEFCQHPDQLSASKQLERSFARFKRNMNKVLLLNYITLTKLRTLFRPIFTLLVSVPAASTFLYALVCTSLIMGMLPSLAFAIGITVAALSAILIWGLLSTIRDLKACRAENQSIKDQASVIQDVKNQFGKLTKEHGLFKVKKRVQVGEAGMEPSLRGAFR